MIIIIVSIFTYRPQFFLPPLLSVPPTLPLCPEPPPTPPLFLFRKAQAFHGSQPNMAYQFSVRLSISPSIKAWQDNPVWWARSQKTEKESTETVPAPTVRHPTIRSSYTSVMYCSMHSQSHAESLIIDSFSVSPWESSLVDCGIFYDALDPSAS